MTKQHPITPPPPELVREWNEAAIGTHFPPYGYSEYIATEAARWGADQELEACCEWIHDWYSNGSSEVVGNLRNDRRPKPVPALLEDATVIKPSERTISVPIPEPVPVAERPWEREGWCNGQDRCWWGRQETYNWYTDWTLATYQEIQDSCDYNFMTDCLPAHALPIPAGEPVDKEMAELAAWLRMQGEAQKPGPNSLLCDKTKKELHAIGAKLTRAADLLQMLARNRRAQ